MSGDSEGEEDEEGDSMGGDSDDDGMGSSGEEEGDHGEVRDVCHSLS